jgi:hypothetical protein
VQNPFSSAQTKLGVSLKRSGNGKKRIDQDTGISDIQFMTIFWSYCFFFFGGGATKNRNSMALFTIKKKKYI